jgi:DNA mismatch endonuclease (patch repair protein)
MNTTRASRTSERPKPLSAEIEARMKRQARRDTKPEMALRRELHALGLRYRVDRSPLPGMRTRADIVFGPAKVAVFVDGCFWHSCPQHRTLPKNNQAWWRAKLDANTERDDRVNRQLREAGWLPIHVWEHEDITRAAKRIAREVGDRRAIGLQEQSSS